MSLLSDKAASTAVGFALQALNAIASGIRFFRERDIAADAVLAILDEADTIEDKTERNAFLDAELRGLLGLVQDNLDELADDIIDARVREILAAEPSLDPEEARTRAENELA